MSEPTAPTDSAEIPMLISTLPELLQDISLHSPRAIKHLFTHTQSKSLFFPDQIHVHCDHDRCEGVRRHIRKGSGGYVRDEENYEFVSYICTNCVVTEKVFGLKAYRTREGVVSGECIKIYQEPPFGQPIPKRLFEVIGEANREYFLQARRAIARGLGIGAYAYYRRIVENAKLELVSSVLAVAQATKASPEQVELLTKAKSEPQFSKAVDMLRGVSAIPAVLLIDGHNPLTLLHDILSEGIHQFTDEDCLQRASEAEIILCELAARMQIAITERKSVKAAIASVLNRKSASTGS